MKIDRSCEERPMGDVQTLYHLHTSGQSLCKVVVIGRSSSSDCYRNSQVAVLLSIQGLERFGERRCLMLFDYLMGTSDIGF